MPKSKKNIVLPDELTDKFEVVNNPKSGHFIDPKFGEVNLYKLTLRHAEYLVNNGFVFLKKKEPSPKKK